MDLYTDLGLDSMELLRLTLSIEKKFNIEIKHTQYYQTENNRELRLPDPY